MPCYITGSELGDQELFADEAREEAQKVTELLCVLCQEWEMLKKAPKFPPAVEKWWKKHKKQDKRK